jgi:MoxR-like ATPase
MPESGSHAVYATAALFRDRCLERGTSLLWPDRTAWTTENIDELLDAFIANPDEGAGTFVEKWNAQLAGKSADVHCIAADTLTFYFLFPDNISASAKLSQIDTVASWKLGAIQERALLLDAFVGIGPPGLHYITSRPWQMAYLLIFGRDVIESHPDMHDAATVRRYADSAKSEVRALKQKTAKNPNYQRHEGEAARNVLLHLLFPTDFEAIASETHRGLIVHHYAGLASGATDTDAALAAIRAGLTPRFGPGFNFYSEEVRAEWDPEVKRQGRFWIEKTQVTGRPDREEGSLAFGQVLWSPQEDNRGGDTYRFMRDVAEGDFVLHLQDRRAVSAFSRVASSPDSNFVCPPKTQWAGRPGYVTRLKDFTRIDPPLTREAIFSPQFAERLLDLLEAGTKNLFYNRELALNQGAYFTPAPAELTDILDDMYQELSGHTLTSLISDVKSDRDPLQDFAEATFLPRAELQGLIDLLEDKQQIILEGPPGAGKTYVAEHLARHLTGNPLKGTHNDRLSVIQFHQSYGYEDFIQGIRPETRDGHIEYHLRDGVFKDLVQRASDDRKNKYVMLIDEINRGNMSRIFGELLYLLEYREKSVTLPSSDEKTGKSAGSRGAFSIPDNVYIIGTMNTADRSLAQLDYALRRRFYFYRLSPVSLEAAPVLEAWLIAKQYPADVRELVLKLFLALNERLAKELGHDYLVGHSYMMRGAVETDAGRRAIWKHAVLPLLGEYFYNRQDRAILENFTIDALLNG